MQWQGNAAGSHWSHVPVSGKKALLLLMLWQTCCMHGYWWSLTDAKARKWLMAGNQMRVKLQSSLCRDHTSCTTCHICLLPHLSLTLQPDPHYLIYGLLQWTNFFRWMKHCQKCWQPLLVIYAKMILLWLWSYQLLRSLLATFSYYQRYHYTSHKIMG